MSEDTPKGLDRIGRHEQWLLAQDMVRGFSASKYRNLVDVLEPMVDGSYGPINPRMVEVYLKTLADLNRLYGAYNPVPEPQEEQERQDPAEMEAEREARVAQLRVSAEAQLRELEARKPGR